VSAPDVQATDPREGHRWPCALALALLLVLGGLAAWGARTQLNPDAICYLRLASLMRDGDVAASVSGYWSPLFTWSLVPFLAAGVEQLLAARLALVLWGVVGVVAADRLAARLGLPPAPRAAALVVVALTLADLATKVITPDVVVGSCLLAYAACVMHPDLLRRRRVAALAGAWAGLAYLAKSYALPFALVHVLLTATLRWRAHAGDGPAGGPRLRDLVATVAVAVGALLIIALPWIAALSLRHGRPTWTTVGPIAHASAGPHAAPGTVHHPLDELRAPAPPHRSVWETPEVLPYPEDWSALESRANALHQLRIVTTNAWKVLRLVSSWDLVGLAPFLAAGPLVVVLMGRRRLLGLPPPLLEWCAWVPATFAVYAGGYILVYVEDRYLRPFLLPLLVLLVASGASALHDALRSRARRAWPALALLAASSVMFAVRPARALGARAFGSQATIEIHEGLRRGLAGVAPPGPVALLCHQGGRRYLGTWFNGQEFAYYLDRTFVGVCHLDPPDATGCPTAPSAPEALDALHVATLVAVRPGNTEVATVPGWVRRTTVPIADGTMVLDLLVRR
jgi:4-amino-4-deoxy-L-arabinose transferase-like glycosyltransferase